MNQEQFKIQSEELSKAVPNLDNGDLPTANIIVAGIAGVGKSTLLNAVFGENFATTGVGRPVTTEIKAFDSPNIPIMIWDTPGFELDHLKTETTISNIRKTIADKASSKDLYDRIHAIWFCLMDGRYQDAEMDFVKSLYTIGVPFILVVTKCVDDESGLLFQDKVKALNQERGMGDIEVVRVLSIGYKTSIGIIPPFGLEKLVNTTLSKMPEFVKSGLVAAQQVDAVNKRIESEKVIVEYTRAAKNGFFDKVPLINYFTTDKKIRNMTKKIGTLYNTHLSDDDITRVIDDSGFTSRDAFQGLILDIGFKKKVESILDDMRNKDGFEVHEHDFTSSERAARMIAFYGYTFTMAIEEYWYKKFVTEELKDVDDRLKYLINIINKKLNEMRRGQRGK